MIFLHYFQEDCKIELISKCLTATFKHQLPNLKYTSTCSSMSPCLAYHLSLFGLSKSYVLVDRNPNQLVFHSNNTYNANLQCGSSFQQHWRKQPHSRQKMMNSSYYISSPSSSLNNVQSQQNHDKKNNFLERFWGKVLSVRLDHIKSGWSSSFHLFFFFFNL